MTLCFNRVCDIKLGSVGAGSSAITNFLLWDDGDTVLWDDGDKIIWS